MIFRLLAVSLLCGFSLSAAPQAGGGVSLDGAVLVLRHPGVGLESRPDYGFHGIFITNGATLRLGHLAGQSGAEYTIANDIEINRGVIESTAGNPHFTGRITVGPRGATFITRSKGQDIYFDSDVSGAGPLSIDNESGGTGGIVRFTNEISLLGTLTITGGSPGFNGGRIFLGDPDALNQTTLVAVAGMRGIDFDPATKVFSLGGLEGNGNIDLQGKILRVGIVSTDTVFSGSLTDSVSGGNLVKSGSGSLTLTGNQSPTANLSVYIGTLVVDGSVESEIKVGNPRIPLARAVLSGTGSLADILLQTPGAILQPGPAGIATGIINARNFSMIPGSNLSIRLGDHGCDQIHASGQFSLYGNLEVSLIAGFRPKPGGVFYIMTTTGSAPVLGRFSNLVSNDFTAAGHRFRINYTADYKKNDPASTTGHDVALIVLPDK
jgi:autotransporter-associated beta strand protein